MTVQEETEKKQDLKSRIIAEYQEYLLVNGTNPASVYAFCKHLEINEAEFYQYFSDFDQIAAHFWTHLFQSSLKRLEQTEEWPDFTTRERLLSFYFSFFEALKSHRSYATLILAQVNIAKPKGAQELSEFKKDFKNWSKEILAEGQQKEEIAGRSKLNDIYDDLFWIQCLFLLDFWRKDRSIGFESTDEAIEKSVNLAFDLIEKNALDSAFDFGKFIFQNR